MAENKISSLLGNYTSIRSLKKSGHFFGSAGDKPSGDDSADRPALNLKAPGRTSGELFSEARIRQTSVPERFDIVCYVCQYAFSLQGRIVRTMCPKCHNMLLCENHVISGSYAGILKTIGNIEVKAGAFLDNAELVARNITLRGNAANATLRATERLELCTYSKFNIDRVSFKDLNIGTDIACSFTKHVFCNNLDTDGTLYGTFYCSGSAKIGPHGSITGELKARRLMVEDGGGLEGTVEIIDGR